MSYRPLFDDSDLADLERGSARPANDDGAGLGGTLSDVLGEATRDHTALALCVLVILAVPCMAVTVVLCGARLGWFS